MREVQIIAVMVSLLFSLTASTGSRQTHVVSNGIEPLGRRSAASPQAPLCAAGMRSAGVRGHRRRALRHSRTRRRRQIVAHGRALLPGFDATRHGGERAEG
jgi:hypothetical protein